MISFYHNLVHPEENVLRACRELLTALRVSITEDSIQHDLESHPDYPSLLSVSDVLAKYGINSVSARISANDLKELEYPYIVFIRD